MILSNCASGSGSCMGGENCPLPLREDVLGLVRWLCAYGRFPIDATDSALSLSCGDIGRLDAREIGRTVDSCETPFRFAGASAPARALELSIR
jgi:hypothetical protein